MTKTVLVTGASRGIGRAVAIMAGSRGWSVGVNYVNDKVSADSAVAAITAAGGKAIAAQGDAGDEAQMSAVFEATEKALGKLDGLVVNAGILATPAPVADMTIERIRRTFEVNAIGAYIAAREGARRMSTDRGGRGGSIVLVSSIAVRICNPNAFLDYAGSKAAMDTLAIGLSKELAHAGVRVNAVRPGIIDTDIHASGGEPDRARVVGATTPMGRPGRPDEVAEAIVWLLSDAASYTTGAILDVAGGR